MLVFILVLLLLAAVFGVLGAVLKAVAFLVITALLTAVVLGTIGYLALRGKVRRFQREMTSSPDDGTSARYLPNEADPGDTPGRDDRY